MSASSLTLERISEDESKTSLAQEVIAEQDAIYYPITQRDPNDIRMILRLAAATFCFAILCLTLAGLLIYRLTRSAEVIVVERTAEGDRVVGDDRHHTLQGVVQLRADTPGDGDKKYLVSKWAESFFQIDPQTRRADIVRGLKLMTPEAAVALVDQVKQSGEWETQRREEWQATWKPQVVTVNADDPYKVQLVGKQEIIKTVAGAIQHAGRQIICTLALRADTAKRTEDNQNTGFRVAGIVEMRVLDESVGSAANAAGQSNPPSISVAPPQAGH